MIPKRVTVNKDNRWSHSVSVWHRLGVQTILLLYNGMLKMTTLLCDATISTGYPKFNVRWHLCMKTVTKMVSALLEFILTTIMEVLQLSK